MGQERAGAPTLGGAQLWADRRWRNGWRVQTNVLLGRHRLLDPDDRRVLAGTLEACIERLPEGPCPEELVVVLHGLGRSRKSMRSVEPVLREAGFGVARLDYPSTRLRLEAHVATLVELMSDLPGTQRMHFVTHSLGGILARRTLASEDWPGAIERGRLVMFAPPSQGASLARALDAKLGGLFEAVMGPSGRQIAGDDVAPLPAVPFLVVAGSTRNGRGTNPLIPGDDDGIVGVEETRLPGMAHHVVVDSIHTLVMNHPQAHEAMRTFLLEDRAAR